jgi:hypothetical protein
MGSETLNIIEWCTSNTNHKPSRTEQTGSVVLRFLPNTEELLPAQKQLWLESQLESLRERVLALLSSGPMSKSEMAAGLGQRQPSGQLHKVIRLLLEEGAIAHTIPGKPQSRLQKYALVTGNGSIKENNI